MGCYPVFFFTIVIFLVICCQKHIPLLHSALYCLHPLHSRFIQSFLCMYWFLYVQFSRCGLYKNRCWCMQKCHRNSSTGSIFAIFSWFLYWKMCDRLATIRIWCYTYSCSRERYRFFRESVLTYGMILAYHSEDRCFGECRSSFFVSNYIICSPLFICDTYLTHVCMSLYLSMELSYHRFIVVSMIFIHFYFIFLYLFIIIVLYK